MRKFKLTRTKRGLSGTCPLERAVKWWARDHGFEGRSGGWIYRTDSDRPLVQGWSAFKDSRYWPRGQFIIERGGPAWRRAWSDGGRIVSVSVLSDEAFAALPKPTFEERMAQLRGGVTDSTTVEA